MTTPRRAAAWLRGLSLAAAHVLALLGTGCSDDSSSDPASLTVGLLLPFTGSDSATSSNFERAVLFARDEVNRGGGVGGHELRVISADTHSDVTRARQSAEELIDAGVSVVIGPESADAAKEIKPLLDAAGVVLLSPVVGAADDRQVDCTHPWFRLAPSARALGEALAKNMVSDGHTRAAVLSSPGDYDRALTQAFSRRLASLGGEVAYTHTLAPTSQSYSSEIRQALDANVDAVLLSTSPSSAAILVNEMGVLARRRPDWYLSPLLKTELLLQNVVPEILEGAQGVTPRIYDVSDDFPNAFAERWAGDMPLEGAYFYYDALALVAFGLEKTLYNERTVSPESLTDAMLDVAGGPGEPGRWEELPRFLPRIRDGENVYYTGLTGPMLLRNCGDRQVGASSVWRVHDGRIEE